MNKIKGFIFSEKRLSGAIFGFLVIAAFVLVFGPNIQNIYAQFSRQDGPTGWGYGYGYGYGYGGGFDGGLISGYRTDGSANPDIYEYGHGYGYLDSGVTYSAGNGYEVTPSNMSNLVQSGVMVPNAGNINSTTQVAFQDKVTMTVAAGTTIAIPSGTTFTAGSTGDFSALAASGTVDTSALTGVDLAGSISFGLPNLGLTVSPAITISINVGTSRNGQTLKIYRKDAGGSWVESPANTDATCLVASGICTFTTTHLSSFSAGNSSGGGSGGSSGGGSSVNATTCANVVYSEYETACFAGYQYRTVVSRTPSNCSMTVAQQEATKRACVNTVPPTVEEPVVVDTSNLNTSNFIALERSLVKKINKLLTGRLAGRILLQVEGQGQAWYVNPVNGSKYFLGRPADAFALMRKLALGVSNKTWATFKNGKAPAKLAGRILLKVEDKGMAYYVNPVDLKLHYLGRPADAFSVMRGVGLGISNANLRQISVGEVK